MTRRNRTKRNASSSPEEVLPINKTRRNKLKQQCTVEQPGIGVQMDNECETSTGNMDSAVLSLGDLHKLIQQDITQANHKTMARIDGVASRIDGAISKLQSDVEEMKNSQQFISDEFEAVKSTLSGHDNAIRSMLDEIHALKKDNSSLRTYLEEMNFEVNALKQKSLESHFLISNVIKTNDENLHVLIERISNHLDIPFNASNFLGVSRMASKNQKGVQPVLVRSVNVRVKEQFMNAVKDRPFTCEEIGLGLKQQIYFNHHLTPSNQRILGAARKFRKEHNYRFVWFSHGSVFIRKDENSKIIRVHDIHDLPTV